MRTIVKAFMLTLLVVVLTISLMVVACAPAEEAEEVGVRTYQWKTTTNVGPEWPPGMYLNELVDKISKDSNGRIELTPYWADELGDWTWVMQQVSRGEIEMASNPAPTEVDPRLNVTHMQYLFLGYEGAKKALGPDGTLIPVYKDLFEDSNWYLLGTFPTGAYGVSLRYDLVRSPEDAKGIKIRVMPVKACEWGLNAMGFSATPIPFSELHTALQTGIVDARAQATPIEPMMFEDVLKYHVVTYDNFELHFTVLNLDLWNSLAPEDQRIFQNAVDDRAGWWWDHYLDEIEKPYLDEFDALPGKEVIYLTNAELAAFAERVREEAWPKMKELIGTTLYDKMVAVAEPLP